VVGVVLYSTGAYALDIAKIRTQSIRFRLTEARGQLL